MALLAAPAGAQERSPRISAPAAVIVDARDGHVLYRREATDAARDRIDDEADDRAGRDRGAAARRSACGAVNYAAGAAESRIDLRPGERMAVADLLRALLLESANDAAVTLARARRRLARTRSWRA